MNNIDIWNLKKSRLNLKIGPIRNLKIFTFSFYRLSYPIILRGKAFFAIFPPLNRLQCPYTILCIIRLKLKLVNSVLACAETDNLASYGYFHFLHIWYVIILVFAFARIYLVWSQEKNVSDVIGIYLQARGVDVVYISVK